jgi:hypothetical protein
MWCIGELDEEYIRKMEDVLAVYEKPFNPAEPVVCLDEKPVPLHADIRPPIPVKPGKPARQDNEYERCGTANVFGVVEPKTGRHFTTATPDRSGAEFARMVGRVVEQYPAAETIHLVMDNLNIHSRKSLTDHFGEQEGGCLWDRLTVHYTPSTAVGSIRRRSKSGCLRGSAWAHDDFRIWRFCRVRPEPGTAKQTGNGPGSTGGSRVVRPERSSGTRRPATEIEPLCRHLLSQQHSPDLTQADLCRSQ